jgi:hypothetical protein
LDSGYPLVVAAVEPLERFPITLTPPVVIAGLDPAIHPLRKKMDARVKPAHDGGETEST